MNSVDVWMCETAKDHEHEVVESRRARLLRLKSAIEEGRYVVSSDVLAEKLMRHMMSE